MKDSAPITPLPPHDVSALHLPRGRIVPLSVWAVIAGFFLANVAWLSIDTRPYNWDDAWYAEQAIRLNDAWVRGGISGAVHYFTHAMGAKAPLIIALPQPLILLFGRSEFAFGLTSAVALAVASVYLALLARLYVSEAAATVALVVFSLMPLASGLSRQFMVEMPLTAILLMFIYHLLRSGDMQDMPHAIAAGIAAGLGMLAKITFPLFAIGLFAWLYARLVRHEGRWYGPIVAILAPLIGPAVAIAVASCGYEGWGYLAGLSVTAAIAVWIKRRASPRHAHLALALAVAIWFPLPWYLQNAAIAFEFARSASIGEASKYYGSEEIVSWPAIRDYWIANLNFGVGLVFVASLALAAVCALSLSSVNARRTGAEPLRRRILVLVAVWVIPALIVFTLGRNRTTRFLLPLLPAAALIYAALVESIARRARAVAGALVALHIVPAFAAYLISSFAPPINPRENPPRQHKRVWALDSQGRFIVWSPEMSGRGSARRRPFPLRAVLDQALRVSRVTPERTVHATFLTDKPNVNLNSIALEAAKCGARVDFNATAYQSTLEHALGTLPGSDVLIYQEGGEAGPDYTNRWGQEIRKRIDAGQIAGWRLNEDASVRLPDGGIVKFYERAGDSSEDMVEFSTCVALYKDSAYALLGYALRQEREGLHLATRWIKLRPDDGHYVIAVHLINSRDRYTFNADYYPRGGASALAGLGVGESIVASTFVPAGEWAGRAQSLHLALYDVDTRRNVLCRVLDGLTALPNNWGRLPVELATSRPAN